jgi:hypothetical protein
MAERLHRENYPEASSSTPFLHTHDKQSKISLAHLPKPRTANRALSLPFSEADYYKSLWIRSNANLKASLSLPVSNEASCTALKASTTAAVLSSPPNGTPPPDALSCNHRSHTCTIRAPTILRRLTDQSASLL